MNYKYTYESPLGTMIMLGTLSYLTDLFFIDEAYAPSYDDAEYIEQLTGPFEVTIMWLNQYFNGKKPFITPPIQLLSSVNLYGLYYKPYLMVKLQHMEILVNRLHSNKVKRNSLLKP